MSRSFVKFVCAKDPQLAEYYTARFGTLFTADAQDADGHVTGELIAKWNAQMLAEADYQEHYDFTVDADGRRQPIPGPNGPALLIPTVEVTTH